MPADSGHPVTAPGGAPKAGPVRASLPLACGYTRGDPDDWSEQRLPPSTSFLVISEQGSSLLTDPRVSSRSVSPAAQTDQPPIDGEDEISSLHRSAVLVETRPHQPKRRHIHQQPQSMRLLRGQRRRTHLHHMAAVRPALPTPPRRHDHRRMPAGVKALHRLVMQHHTGPDTQPGGKLLGRGPRPRVGRLGAVRPRQVGVRESAHSRRMRHRDVAPSFSIKNTAPTEQVVGEADRLLMNPVMAGHLAPGRQRLADSPLACSDATADVSGDASVRRFWHSGPWRN